MPTANPPGRTLWLMAAIVLVGLNLRPPWPPSAHC